MADIFLHLNGAQHGPYTAEQLQAWLRDGTVAANTLAWREGMADWQPLSAWGGMVPAPAPHFQPMVAPRAQRPQSLQVYHPAGTQGLNRLQYFGFGFLVNLLIWGLFWVAVFLVAGANSSNAASPESLDTTYTLVGIGYILCLLLSLGIAIWLGVKRLQNIGWHGGLAALLVVPLVNLFMALCLIALPPGYARTKDLDGPAWCWIVLVLLFVAAVISVIVMGVATDFSQLRDLPSFRPASP